MLLATLIRRFTRSKQFQTRNVCRLLIRPRATRGSVLRNLISSWGKLLDLFYFITIRFRHLVFFALNLYSSPFPCFSFFLIFFSRPNFHAFKQRETYKIPRERQLRRLALTLKEAIVESDAENAHFRPSSWGVLTTKH